MFCNCLLRSSLVELAELEPGINIKATKRILSATWNPNEIEILDENGEPIHGLTHLSNALGQRFTVRVVFEADYEPEDVSPRVIEDRSEKEDDAISPEQHGASAEVLASSRKETVDPIVERVITSLAAQERRRDFIWAGFVVNDLLPGLGAEKREAQVLFDRMVDDGIISLSKTPNPNNPDFPSTRVQLNRDHPDVQRVLSKNGRTRSFEPVAIRGEPLSTTIKRERR